MSKRLMWCLVAVVMIVASPPARATDLIVGNCVTPPKFSTISAAVAAAHLNDRVLVCPANYPEQVILSQPMTLQGLPGPNVGLNVDRPVIVPPPNGLTINWTSIDGTKVGPQVLAANTSGQAGNIVISGVTVDGTGAELPGCSTSTFEVGILYGNGTAGTVNHVTVRNQQLPSCGIGIWIENGASGSSESITVENSSVHDQSFKGIFAFSNLTPPTLTATIKGNFVNETNLIEDIIAENVGGTITGSVITGGLVGISGACQSTGCPLTISNNSVADMSPAAGPAIAIGDMTAATGNKISNANIGFAFGGSGVSPGPMVTGNTTKNTTTVISYGCIPNVTVKSNSFNDSLNGFQQVPTTNSGLGTNLLFNIDNIQVGPPCP